MEEQLPMQKNIYESLKIVAPGTFLREGLENIVKAKTGALIVVGDTQQVLDIVDGGFYINSEFTPAHLYELAKMDGAIILSKDCKKILYANAQLIPDSSIISNETGIRHRTAERVATQTGELVIAISQRRSIITLYKGTCKYIIKDSSKILNNANQAIQTLEKYKAVLKQETANLGALEFEDLVTVYDVVKVLQRTEMVMRVSLEIKKYIIELGNEGRLISMQLEELIDNVEEDGINIIRDYCTKCNEHKYLDIKKDISRLSSEELLNLTTIASLLGYDDDINSLDKGVHAKGYRFLSKIPRLPSSVIENVINMFGSFQGILKASISQLDAAEGIGEIRAKTIKESLRRFQEQFYLDRHI